MIGNADFSIWINQYHFPFLDIFFKYITYLGDGLAALLVLILLLVIRLDYGLISAIGFTLSALTTQTLKRFVFGEVPRPFLVFKEQIDIGQWHLIDGVEMHQFYSFPSGHTTSIFSICILLSLIINQKKYNYIFFMIALLVGFSRIYLSQHFLMDVFVGSLVGSMITIFTFLFLRYRLKGFKKYSILRF
ncbi:MAG: phosphatase PAP2 family protein [Bacteroidota bacterium]|nr:phosphatase PAP2 family protein [Bacteroidota bacterium]